MAKKGIKTARYWTRTCPNCQFEYPNWFTNCPKCKATWKGEGAAEGQEVAEGVPIGAPSMGFPTEKTIRIIAQLTEDDVKIKDLNIFFSADNGISWFSMPMVREEDYFVAEIANVSSNSTVVYYLKGVDETGVEFVEDNNAEFYYYYVGEMEMKQAAPPPQPAVQKQSNDIAKDVSEIFKSVPPAGAGMKVAENPNKGKSEQDKPVQISGPPEFFSQNNAVPAKVNAPAENKQPASNPSSGVQFTPLNQIKKDANLKICPNCKSNVKSQWSVCPICGHRF